MYQLEKVHSALAMKDADSNGKDLTANQKCLDITHLVLRHIQQRKLPKDIDKMIALYSAYNAAFPCGMCLDFDYYDPKEGFSC